MADDAVVVKLNLLHEDVKDMKTVLKELTTAINRLAVVEERQTQFADSVGRAFKGLEEVRIRVLALETVAVASKQTNDWAGKALWAAAAAGVMFVAKKAGLL
jgi:hypothetical protein